MLRRAAFGLVAKRGAVMGVARAARTVGPVAPAPVGRQVRWCMETSEAEKKEIMDEMKNDIKSSPVCLFMKGEPEAPRCGFSSRAVDLMGQYGVSYTSYNVLAHPAVREGIKEISGWPTIPQLFVGGEFIGGCDLMMEMHESGDLADLFKNADIQFKHPKTGVLHTPSQGPPEQKE